MSKLLLETCDFPWDYEEGALRVDVYKLLQTIDNFEQKLALLIEQNWKVAALIRDCGNFGEQNPQIQVMMLNQIIKS